MSGSLSGGACLEHLQAEHHHLNHELLAIRHQLEQLACEAKSRPGGQTTVRGDLEELGRNLRCHLESHFREEEAGGCMEDALIRCPSLSHEGTLLMAEHRLLLDKFDSWLRQVRSRDAAASPAELSKAFEDFVCHIKAHEVAESRLMQCALGGAASEYDVEGND